MIYRTMRIVLCAGAVVAGSTMAAEAPAPDGANRDNGAFEITADRDLEWLQQDQAYVARGNAIAKRGKVTLTGDSLIGYYRKLTPPAGAGQAKPPAAPTPAATTPATGAAGGFDAGSTDIWRIVAEGHVHISSEGREAWGDRMDYDKDQGVVVLTGNALKGTSPTGTVVARDSLEYWQNQDMAVARGDAVMTKPNGQTLSGDVIGAHFEKDAQGHSTLKTIQANGHVVIKTATDTVHGDQGTYDLVTRRSVVFGNVRVSRDLNELEGESAEVNMDTGISQIFPGQGKRVHGLFVKTKGDNAQPAPGGAQPVPGAAQPAPGGAQPDGGKRP